MKDNLGNKLSLSYLSYVLDKDYFTNEIRKYYDLYKEMSTCDITYEFERSLCESLSFEIFS